MPRRHGKSRRSQYMSGRLPTHFLGGIHKGQPRNDQRLEWEHSEKLRVTLANGEVVDETGEPVPGLEYEPDWYGEE